VKPTLETRISLPRQPNRSAYTLIEMLIAVSLVAVLMTAVWGLTSMYATLQTTGANATAEQQLVRSVFQLLQDDLANVSLPVSAIDTSTQDPFAAFEPVDAGFGAAESDEFVFGSVSTVFEIGDLIRNEHVGPANIEFRGTRDAVRITVAAAAPPARRSEGETDQPDGTFRGQDGRSPVVAEFQTIVYQFQKYGSGGDLSAGLYRIQADAAELQGLLRGNAPSDGARRESIRLDSASIERLLFPSTNDRSSESKARQVSCDLIPDVTGGSFEFFDGDRWHREWNRDRTGTIPTAVRVTMDVVTAEELDILQTHLRTSGTDTRLQKYLQQAWTRTERPQPASPENALSMPQITPRQYRATILLNTTETVSSSAVSDLGKFEL